MRGQLVAELDETLRYKPIPDGVTGIIHWHNPSGRIMALGSAQHLKEMSTGNNSWRMEAAGI